MRADELLFVCLRIVGVYATRMRADEVARLTSRNVNEQAARSEVNKQQSVRYTKQQSRCTVSPYRTEQHPRTSTPHNIVSAHREQ